MVFDLIQYGFMQRALISAIAISVICSIVGLFLVLKRHSLFGDALAHVAFGGISLGLFLGVYPLWTAYIVAILSAVGVNKLRESTKIPPDSSIAVLLTSGLAIGVILISISGGFTLNLFSLLFGNILLVSNDDVIMILITAAIVIPVIYILYKKLVLIIFDENQAKVSGLNVTWINTLFIILASITIIASIRLVGVLLISSLIVIPNITALMLGKGFKKTIFISCAMSVFSVVFGIVISYYSNVAPSGMIVLTMVSMFLITVIAKNMKIRFNKIVVTK
ncbi:MAG: metal ABC transporter permease [Nitrososphaeraceae archaeon]|nr:metal ABC transporter permease [Nitrososphaeraceae archaeon]MDW0142830.1 metal ABC transporter permease [Nitrososphaeraceae archaeon]MDW0158291.1 metal ABC transporter permease [Nitrososphaeraceae archaeon]